MSTNPFRRSSFKGPGENSGGSENIPVSSTPYGISDTGKTAPTPLSVNTKASSTNQKHVNFASPPAIPISPVSYPPSPESTRISPEYAFARPILPSPTDYSNALQSDPFQAEAGRDENDGAIEQALENAKANTALAAPSLETSKEDAVKNTLSRFASAPKRPAATTRDGHNAQSSASQRQAMDVDAFKRMLMTGDAGQKIHAEEPNNVTAPAITLPVTDNSSNTDSASISQRSLFDQGVAMDDSPRTSAEIGQADADSIRQSLLPSPSADTKKKPPPPPPRHGKLLKEQQGAIPMVDQTSSPAPVAATTAPSSSSRKPPTPPLARKRSQNSGTTRRTSSSKSPASDIDQASSVAEGTSRAPPPPRSRRPVSMIERRSSSDLPPTAEESDSADSSVQSPQKPSDTRPTPPPARNASKRVSVGNMNPPPPPPPPRRGRGSSRSSVDSQRPAMSAILGPNDAELADDDLASSQVHRTISGGSYATGILADLAALQREVDEARRKVSR